MFKIFLPKFINNMSNDKKHSLVKSVQFEQKEHNLRKNVYLNQHNF